MKVLKNYPFDQVHPNAITIKETDAEWPEAYKTWRTSSKPPTTDPRWKDGVFMGELDDAEDAGLPSLSMGCMVPYKPCSLCPATVIDNTCEHVKETT